MRRIIFLLVCIVTFGANQHVAAQPYYGSLPPIHVDGKYLRDDIGARINLHGAMDTPNPYFNCYRWGNSTANTNISACRTYFNKLFTAMTDTASGAYCNVFRLHLDPCWTNDPNKTSDGKESGEADISRYSGARLTSYMRMLYWPIAQLGLKHGLYIIMRPPGVCPSKIQVGGDYQKYLIDVWDRVSKNDSVRKYYGHVSLELANEPITCLDANGNDTYKALHDFFQPIVDTIRANGFKGIILIPGTGYQSNYRAYSSYPITDPEYKNIGYAVHDYPGWYSTSDESYTKSTAITSFKNAVPVVTKYPVIVTEIDWSPYKEPKEVSRIDEQGNTVYKNYGTWGTASTSKWGSAFKAVHDYFGNIGMTLTGISDYIDIDEYINNKKVVPAFSGITEACGEACFTWYKEYWQKNVQWKADAIATDIENVETDATAEIVKKEYFSVDGRRQKTVANGINIVRTVYSDGRVETKKVEY